MRYGERMKLTEATKGQEYVAARSFNVMSACAGIGGLDLGIRLAVPSARTVCYLEREGTSAALLAARMRDGFLDDAPIWSDLRTFDARRWRGVVDCFAAGFPCQDVSLAGKGAGLREGTRTGLWFECARIIREARPGIVFLENVPGLVRRGLARVLADLDDLGFDAEWGMFSAAGVGAPHRRSRIFILAWRVPDAIRGILREESGRISGDGDGAGAPELGDLGEGVEDSSRIGRRERWTESTRLERRPDAAESGCEMDNSRRKGLADQRGGGGRAEEYAMSKLDGGAVGDPAGARRHGGEDAGAGSCHARQDWCWGVESERSGGDLADTKRGGLQAGDWSQAWEPVTSDGGEHVADGDRGRRGLERLGGLPEDRDAESGNDPDGCGLRTWPPGPGDREAWSRVPPEAQPAIRGVVDGLPSRNDRLRALGNGVVPLCAAYAFRTLAERI